MNVASLVLGICGVVLASLSLGWQAAQHVLTGGRVKVALRMGGFGNGGMVTMAPRSLHEDWWELLATGGYQRPVVAVTVANVGRLPVTVARWGLKSGLGTLYPAADSIGPPLPHRLEAGESETWAVDMGPVDAFIRASREVHKKSKAAPGRPTSMIEAAMAGWRAAAGQQEDVVGVVELADGRTKQSQETIR
jgi:hypothetical protein